MRRIFGFTGVNSFLNIGGLGTTSDSSDRQFRKYIPITVLMACIGALPLAYSAKIFNEANVFALDGWFFGHVFLNTLTNLICGLFALIVTGRLAAQLNAVWVATGAVHLLLTLGVWGLRLNYSRPLMILALLISLLLSTAIVLLRDNLRSRRVGIVPAGLTGDLMAWVGPSVSIIPSASVSPRNYDEILINFSADINSEWTKFASTAILSGCQVRHAAEYVEEVSGRVYPEHFAVEHVAANPETHSYFTYKRIVDILAVVILAPIALPMIAISGAAIVYTMGYPIFFSQDRVGFGGKQFRMHKLRTMRNLAPGEIALTTTLRGDRRITPLGAFLRRFRIDELPQFWNILRGEMSLVGPRPEEAQLARDYAKSIPVYHYRCLVRPGITGWAQIRSGYANDDAQTLDKVAYDLYYAKYMSLQLDLRIMAGTLIAVMRGSDAR